MPNDIEIRVNIAGIAQKSLHCQTKKIIQTIYLEGKTK